MLNTQNKMLFISTELTNLLFTVSASEVWWTCAGEVLAISFTASSILAGLGGTWV